MDVTTIQAGSGGDMNFTTRLTEIVGLLLALSIASERLVEITKGLVPWLNEEKIQGLTAETSARERRAMQTREGHRRAALQALAVGAGIVTAALASPAIARVLPVDPLCILGLGLLTSGGSGFWNSVLDYMANVNQLNKTRARRAKIDGTVDEPQIQAPRGEPTEPPESATNGPGGSRIVRTAVPTVAFVVEERDVNP